EMLVRHEPHPVDAAAAASEVNRFSTACAAAVQELDAIVARVSKEVGEEEAGIFRAHRLLLRDPAFVGKVNSIILTQKVDAPTALQEVVEGYTALFGQIQDEYLKERMADIRDVVGRLLTQLALQRDRPTFEADEPIILVAPEILPSQAMA